MMLNTNISLQVSNRLQETTQSLARSLERLSTGKRINSARDDLAGFSVVTTLNAQVRGLSQANLNINQARGLIQTADAAISVQLEIVQKMRELAVQGASSSLTSEARSALNSEVTALMDEFRRITSETEFNGTKLLDGTFGSKDFQVGASYGQTTSLEISSLRASDVFRRNVGTGSFLSAVTYAIGDAPSDVVLADLDGDGILDMSSIEDSTSDQVSVRLGVGDGTFGAATTIAAGSSPAQIRAGDVNGDGVEDLVVSDNGNTIDIFIGNGDGSFQSRVTYAVTDGAEFVLADIDSDNSLDIVSATSAASVSILLNNGDGTFQSEVTHATSTTSNQIQAADFDNDGNMDVVITTAGSGTSQVLRGNGSGGFSNLSTFATGGTSANNIVGDFNGDGYADVLVAYGSATTVAVRLGVGDGTFTSASNFTAGGNLLDMEVGDFNNDGKLDFIGRTASAYYINVGNGNGGFTQLSTGALTANATGIQVGDLNQDGVDDFITANSAATDTVSVYIGAKTRQSAESQIDLSTQEKAAALIGILDETLEELLEERTSLAVSLNQLDSIESYNLLQSESLAEAKTLIEEADVAQETAELVRLQILEQAQISVLGQANVNMQVVLALFQ